MKIIKIIFLLILSLGLLWFSENFPIWQYLEPQSTGWILWMSYAKDLIQPFAFYFFICFLEEAEKVRRTIKLWKTPLNGIFASIGKSYLTWCDALLGNWRRRAIIAFAVPTLMEFGQIFIRVLIYRDQLLYMGNFDPWDIPMYAIGVGLAVLLEQKLFAKFFKDPEQP